MDFTGKITDADIDFQTGKAIIILLSVDSPGVDLQSAGFQFSGNIGSQIRKLRVITRDPMIVNIFSRIDQPAICQQSAFQFRRNLPHTEDGIMIEGGNNNFFHNIIFTDTFSNSLLNAGIFKDTGL